MFFQHYTAPFLPPVFEIGWVGVDLFFVLSGFLITGILFDTRSDSHRFRNFYVRRGLRIFPLYYAVVAGSAILFHAQWSRVWALVCLYLTNYVRYFYPSTQFLFHLQIRGHAFVLAYEHLWSLALEEQFYLAWPLIVFAVKDRVRLRNLCLAVVALEPGLRALLYWRGSARFLDAHLLYYGTPFRLDALLLGGALALALRGPERKVITRWAAPALAMTSTGFVAAWSVGTLLLHEGAEPAPWTGWVIVVGFTLLDLAMTVAVLLSLEEGNAVHRFGLWSPLRWVGQIGYGFYMYHYLLIGFFLQLGQKLAGRMSGHQHLWAGIFSNSIGLAAILAISYASFRFFEAPFLRLKDRFTRMETP